MIDERCLNVYVEENNFCICDETGKEFFALKSINVVQNWGSKTANPREGLAEVTFTVVANLYSNKEEMINRLKIGKQ